MMDGIIAGKLHGNPAQRMAKTGRPFATARLRASTSSGESLFVSCVAFDAAAVAALLALGDGDSVAVSGSLTPKAWIDRDGEPRPGLDVVVHQVLTAYHVRRKRAAVAGEHEGQAPPRAGPAHERGDGLDDGQPLDL